MLDEGPATWMLDGQPAAVIQHLQEIDHKQVGDVERLKFKLRHYEREDAYE